MSERGLSVALAGATGALGSEVVAVLGERRFPLAELLPFAGDRSIGCDVELCDQVIAVANDPPVLANRDLLIVCTPREAGRALVRAALRASVACIDCSGAMLDEEAAPVVAPDLVSAAEITTAPLVTLPPGPALGWAYALKTIDEAAGLARVTATVLQAASHAGARAMDVLSEQTVAVLSQREAQPQDIFEQPPAFDCILSIGAVQADGVSAAEATAALGLKRLLRADWPVSVSAVQVPTFVGDATSFSLELDRDLSPEAALELLAKAPGVRLWDGDGSGSVPTLRDAAGSDQVIVGRVRRDPGHERGLMLWTVSDSVRLAAMAAVRLAELRLTLN